MATIAQGGQLQAGEIIALVDAMTVPEMVGAIARVETKRRATLALPAAAYGLSHPEAEALVCALTKPEMQRTVDRAGLGSSSNLDDSELRKRASIALQHPILSPSELAGGRPSAGSADDKVRARIEVLEASYAAARASMPLGRVSEDENATEAAPLTFGGVVFSPEWLDEFMVTPGEFEETIDETTWAEQLLLMYNDDRIARGLPELEATLAFTAGSHEPGEPAAIPPAVQHTVPPALEHSPSSSPPALDSLYSSSAWLLWEEGRSRESGACTGSASPVAAEPPATAEPPAAARTTGGVPAEVLAYLDGLNAEARQHLHTLYGLGVLRETDPVERHQRYVKAVQSAAGNVKVGFHKAKGKGGM